MKTDRLRVHIINNSQYELKPPFNWYRLVTNVLSLFLMMALAALMVLAMSN